ncbi:hypothetical protein ACP70R_027868 [Stipagrostis hirtigluma subsp. patula]
MAVRWAPALWLLGVMLSFGVAVGKTARLQLSLRLLRKRVSECVVLRQLIPDLQGWWNEDLKHLLGEVKRTNSDDNASDANTINGQPGDLFRAPWTTPPRCLWSTARLTNEWFFGHRLTVVGTDDGPTATTSSRSPSTTS